jgi:4-coumarate--CoA ligase
LGIPTVVMRSFNFDTFLHLVQKHRITLCHLVPPIALQIAKSEKVQEYDLKSLRFVTCGAAALGRELHEAVERRLGVVCVSSFGMTEVCGPAFMYVSL